MSKEPAASAVKIVEITISRSIKINVGDYQSIDYFMSAKAINENGVTGEDTARVERAVESALLRTLTKAYGFRGVNTTPYKIAKMFGLGLASGNADTTSVSKNESPV